MSAVIRGAKGGSSPHTPVESADNLRSISFFRILDLVSEGEIGGLVNGQQSIFLDETPLGNSDGTSNFPKAHIEQRTGTQDQLAIPGFDAVENEISVGVELKSSAAWLHSVSDTTLSALRVTLGVPALSKANSSNGDITGYTISYKIEVSTDSGAFTASYNGSFTGKTTTKFQRSHRIDLPTATTGWQIKVTRLTANANSSAIADVTTVDSYTEIVDAKLRYPNSALIGVMGDASQFQNIPQRAYDLWGRIIKVPSNYDVTTRAYTGVWDGTFKPSWTDNPAWVFYDLVTHARYGLGHLITAAQVDKWELYKIGQYCDGMVSDGNGGTEPRLTCNIYLQTQADAYKLLNDLSTAFRGISYWANGAIMASADMPADPVYTYTDANVIEGKFSYSASARKTRFTTALVSWNDPRNFYRTKVEYVEDRDGIARYGIQQTEVTAVGCASQGQAQRLGRWILLTSRFETDTVTFSVGLDGTLAAPGQIIRIADSARAGKRQGGRAHSATTTAVTVDKAPTVAIGDSLTVIMADGVSQTRTVSAVAGAAITVSVAFTAAPAAQSMWVVESTTLAAQTFRVLAVTEDKSDTDISFTLTCLQHNASKFDAVDTGTIIQVPPVSALKVTNQPGPVAVSLTSTQVVGAVSTYSVMTIAWTAVAGAVSYEGAWRKDDGEWQPIGGVSGLSADVVGTGAGDYTARIRAKGTGNAYSLYTLSNPFTIADNSTLPTGVAAIGAEAVAAQADADAANAALADIASDGILSPNEKPVVIRDNNVILAEQAGIDAQAVAYGITTEKTAYDTAVTALANYLGTLTTPTLWSNLTGNTTIVGATFRSNFASVYTTRQALLNAIYAAAKSKADAAQATANSANATANNAAPAYVINPGFDLLPLGLGWVSDYGTWYVNSGSVSPGVNPNCAERVGSAGTPTDVYRNAGKCFVIVGQQYKAQALIQALGANGTCRVRISWRDASDAEGSLVASYGNVVTGTTTNGSYVVAPAPTGAVYAHVEIVASTHTSGGYRVDNVVSTIQPANVGEVPDGGGRYAVNQVDGNGLALVDFSRAGHVNKNLDNIANTATYLRSVASAQGLVENGDFETGGATVFPPPGWQFGGSIGTGAVTSPGYDTVGPYSGTRSLTFTAAPASGYESIRSYQVTPGDYYAIGGAIAGAGGDAALVLYFLNAAGGIVDSIVISSPTSGFAYSTKTKIVPGAAVSAKLALRNLGAVSRIVEFDALFMARCSSYDNAMAIAGSGQRIGDQRNLTAVTFGNYGSGWSGLTLSYTATTTSATVSASAATLQAGGAAIAYNASSITLSGTAGSVVTYYLYYSDAALSGGAKTMQATTSQITSLSSDGNVLLGKIVVTYPASGTGSGGGAPGCPVRTARVVRRILGGEEEIEAGAVVVGDRLKIINPVTGATRWGLVTLSKPAYVECVRVAQRGGVSLSCSATAPLGGSDGASILAPAALGEVITGMDAGSVVRAEITHVRAIGKCWVQHITCENDFFLAGDLSDRYLAHHNLKP